LQEQTEVGQNFFDLKTLNFDLTNQFPVFAVETWIQILY